MNFYYDALGRCVRRVLNGANTYYIYDGERPIRVYTSTGAGLGWNIYGKGIDEILKRWTSSSGWYFLQQNQEGNVTHLFNTSGSAPAIIERYKYDAFGAPTIYNASGAEIDQSAYKNRFFFTGREYNETFGFYEYRARAYHPKLGRFTSEDPKLYDAGDYNLFRYCNNDPLDLTDPMGLEINWSGQGPQNPENHAAAEMHEVTGSHIPASNQNLLASRELLGLSAVSARSLSSSREAVNAALRARIDRIASSMNGDRSYSQAVRKDDFGPTLPKCNKLLDDVLRKAAVTRFLVRDEEGYIRAASTQEMATRAWHDWERIAREERSGGDVAVFGPDRGQRYGHTGFIISDGKGGLSNISAHERGVYPQAGQFEDNPRTIYLRYTGTGF